MDDMLTVFKRAQELPGAIGASLDGFGGILRCGICHAERPMQPGDGGQYTATGWPKCCAQSMMWWTQRQIDAGEMPA